MNVQGYQKLTLLDFPGRVAATVFTGGCNLRCPFCHNAGLVETPFSSANSEGELLSYLASRRRLLEGVCVTGGEPLLQPDLPAFLQKVKDMGYAVKLDTNGSLPDRLRAILETGLVDYVAMDVKNSEARYGETAGNHFIYPEVEKSIDRSGISRDPVSLPHGIPFLLPGR